MHYNYLENLLQHKLLGPTFSFWLNKSVMGLKGWHFPNDVDVAGTGPPFENHWIGPSFINMDKSYKQNVEWKMEVVKEYVRFDTIYLKF